MQLIEHLRSKRTDAEKHLLSRKRKLAQLYSVTTFTGDQPDPSNNLSYFQQLQAFQDANDLEKGRLFNESTLPTRPQITRLPRSVASFPSKPVNPQPEKYVRRSRSPTKPESSLSLRTAEGNQPRSKPPRSPSVTQTHPAKENGSERADGGSIVAPFGPQGNKSGEVNEALARAAESGLDAGKQLLDIPGPPSQSARASPRRGSEKPDDQSHDATTTSKPGLVHPSPAPPPVPDPLSSPASTSGPVSSNTPVADAGSPNTTPGAEPHLQANSSFNSREPPAAVRKPSTPMEPHSAHFHKESISSLDVEMIDADPSNAFDSSTDLTAGTDRLVGDAATEKPSLRIETKDQTGLFEDLDRAGRAELPRPPTNGTILKPIPAAIPTAEPARRATRIQSGAIQKKSVSEILGETPRSASPHTDSPTSANIRAERERRERERSKLSTVVFAKPQRPHQDLETVQVARMDDPTSEMAGMAEKDYLYTLFESKAHAVNRHGSLPYLLQHSHKTLSTADHLVDYEYQAQCRVLKRLYQLQNNDRWALRQRRRADEPSRSTSHWDFLIDHAKWMRTDFREERRWKMAAARAVAEACVEWVAASTEERKLLQVRLRAPRGRRPDTKNRKPSIDEAPSQTAPSPPELDPTMEDDSVSEDIADPREVVFSTAPAAIFSLGASDFTFAADRTPALEKVLNELPLYQPAKIEPDLAKSNLAEQLDARWKKDIVPASRYVVEKLKVKDFEPPIKRSRYEYDIEPSPLQTKAILAPRETNVALFMPENKHIRDRIHPGHSFRPPSEHPMPMQSFFETRISSQWTAAEDDELRKLVKDYSYNWSLIASCLSPRTLYTAGPDRRSPWECFERWIGLEGMPADMSKTPYFKTYSGRIEAAGRLVQAQIEEAQRRAGANPVVNVRKRTTQPVRVERKRAQRHLAMLDAMRKLAKKREAVRQKALHSADMAAMRKSNEVNQPRLGARTPAEWSHIKYEREQKMAKQQELYRQQLIAHQHAATQRRSQGPTNNGVPGVPQPVGSNARVPAANNAAIPGVPHGHLPAPNGHPRPHPNMLGMPAGVNVPNGVPGNKGVPQSQIQNMARGMANSPQQVKFQQEQLIRQAQQVQQNGAQSSPNGPHAVMAGGQQGMSNAAVMAAMAHVQAQAQAQANGQSSNSSTTPGNATSPRPPSSHMGQGLSSGHVPVVSQIASNIRERNPNMSDEDVTKAATTQILMWQQQATAAAAGQGVNRPKINQAALNAAMGAVNASNHAANLAAAAAAGGNGTPGQGMMSYEQAQQYHQRMRMQQAAQRGIQTPLPPGVSPAVGTGMANSPATVMARPVSQHGQQGQGQIQQSQPSQSAQQGHLNQSSQVSLSRSATPRDQRSGSMGTNPASGVQGQVQGPTPGPKSSPRPPQAPMPT